MRALAAVAAAALAGAVVLLGGALVGESAARAQKRDVPIESEPPGADVYLNSKDDGSLCKTPCTIKVPVGEAIVILEIADHVSLVEGIDVPKRGKVPVARFKLVRAVGTLVVKGPEGALIRLGDVPRGKAPAKLEVDAGPHTLTLTLNGKQVLQDLIEVEANEEFVVQGKDVAAAGGGGGGGGGEDGEELVVIDGGEEGTPEEPKGGVAKSGAPTVKRDPYVALTGLVDIGFRYFTYKGVLTESTLPDAEELAQVIAGPLLELWPGRLAGVRPLRGLALYGRMQFPLNKQQVSGGALMGTVTTFWQSLEIGARQRWTFSKGTVEVGAGFVRDQHQYSGSTADLMRVPDADYRVVKLGVRGSLLLGVVEPYAALENRVVLSGGDAIEDRFSLGATANGFRGALGATAKLGPIDARIEGSATRYSWEFKFDNDDAFKATGASDSILMISAGFGYAY